MLVCLKSLSMKQKKGMCSLIIAFLLILTEGFYCKIALNACLFAMIFMVSVHL